MMEIVIHAKGVDLTRQLYQHIRRRFQVALGRQGFDPLRVRVLVEDLNGPRGGIDKRCAVEIAGGFSGARVFEHRDADIFVAIHRAFDKARTTVARASKRGREIARRPDRARRPHRASSVTPLAPVHAIRD